MILIMIKQYDEVILRDGKSAIIVEVLEEDRVYIADIEVEEGDWETETVLIEEIQYVIEKVKKPISAAV